jgi:hypothetical protein
MKKNILLDFSASAFLKTAVCPEKEKTENGDASAKVNLSVLNRRSGKKWWRSCVAVPS